MSIKQPDYSHIIYGQNYDKYPLKWNLIFNREAPLALEIGFGNGQFLVDWAQRQPDWNFIGIDYSFGSTKRLHKRLMDNSIKNVRIINDDARFTLRELFPDNSIQQVIMNFPDPWPKKRHKERRMVQPNFIQTLGAVLNNGGVFELVTDQFWFAQDTHLLFLESSFFEMKDLEKNPNRSVKTKYEKKWLEDGCEIYKVYCKKKNNNIIHRILENDEMPNYIIKKEISSRQIKQLKDFEHFKDKELFVVKEIYTDFAQKSYLLRVITQDNDYRQTFYIVITRNNYNWVVKLDDAFSVYRTPAVKMAISKLGEILSE